MSNHDQLRKDKTCLNCRHVVENRFCPNCGQKNEDTRKTFHHLFLHFFEDLTHYENAFWKTIKNLLFRPASLTKEYLSGKRLSYLAPVRLYIFISFVTFFTFAIFPDSKKEIDKVEKDVSFKYTSKDKTDLAKDKTPKTTIKFIDTGYDSVKELDSIQKNSSKNEKLSDFEYWLIRKIQFVQEQNTESEIIDKFKESFIHNFPKLLIIYMPLFAFILWLFHNKKRWYYFDHGIFTLHYFSFLLLLLLIRFLFDKIFNLLGNSIIIETVSVFINIIISCWMIYYFFPAKRRFYEETKIKSFIKSLFIFFINIFIITTLLTVFSIYTFINLH